MNVLRICGDCFENPARPEDRSQMSESQAQPPVDLGKEARKMNMFKNKGSEGSERKDKKRFLAANVHGHLPDNSFYMSGSSSMNTFKDFSKLDPSENGKKSDASDSQGRADIKVAFRLREGDSMATSSEQQSQQLVQAHGCIDEGGQKIKASQLKDRKNMFSKEIIQRKFEMQVKELDGQIENISHLCTKYDINRIKTKLIGRIFDCLRQIKAETTEHVELMDEGENFFGAMFQDHLKCVEAEKDFVLPMALKVY